MDPRGMPVSRMAFTTVARSAGVQSSLAWRASDSSTEISM